MAAGVLLLASSFGGQVRTEMTSDYAYATAWSPYLLSLALPGYVMGVVLAITAIPPIERSLKDRRVGTEFRFGLALAAATSFAAEMIELQQPGWEGLSAGPGLIAASVLIAAMLILAGVENFSGRSARFRPYWLCVSREAQLMGSGDEVVETLRPGVWYAAVDSSARGIYIRTDTTSRGLLRDLEAVVK